MTSTKIRQSQDEYLIVAPKNFSECIEQTKLMTGLIVSQVAYDRKFFKGSKFNDKTVNGIPFKIIVCERERERKFAFCLKAAFRELSTQNLRSITIVIISKEDQSVVEEYKINFKYSGDGSILVDISQDDDNFAAFSTSIPLAEKQLKKQLTDLFKHEQTFTKSLEPLPDNFLIRVQLSYFDEVPTYDKYFKVVPIPEDELKEACCKIKLGKVSQTHGKHSVSHILTARSTLVKANTSTEDELNDSMTKRRVKRLRK